MTSLLALFPRVYYDRKMSLVRRDVVDCITSANHGTANLRACLTGQGWPDWSDTLSLCANVDRVMPEASAVFAYKPEGNAKDGVPPIKGLDTFGGKRVLSYNECWWSGQKALREAEAFGATHVVIHHENDYEQWEGHRELGIKVEHIPHCADPRWFATSEIVPYSERPEGALVTGVLSPKIYPLRCHMADLIKTGQIPGRVLKHPGYRLETVKDCYRQAEAYAKTLSTARLSLCCTSVYKYALAKLYESWMAGVPVCGDMPDDSTYRKAFGDLHLECNQDTARSIIEYSLSRPDALESLAIQGRQIAMANFTPRHYVAKFSEFIAD